MKKIKQGQYGYINYEKKKRILVLLLYIFIGILIFVVGYIINKGNKANLFTVIAILSVLPTAKRIVELVVIFPYKTPPISQYEKIKALIGMDATLMCDYVFTSTDKSMALDFLVLEEGNAVGIAAAGKRQDILYIQDYLERNIRKHAPNFEVNIVEDLDNMGKIYKKMKGIEITDKHMEDVLNQLRVLSV